MTGDWWQSKWVTICSLTIGAFGLFAAIYSIASDRSGSELFWHAKGGAVINPPYEGILSGELVDSAKGQTVRVLTIDLWNAGDRGVEPSDSLILVLKAEQNDILKLQWLRNNFAGPPPRTTCSAEQCYLEIDRLREGYGHQFMLITAGSGEKEITVSASFAGGSVSKISTEYTAIAKNKSFALGFVAFLLAAFCGNVLLVIHLFRERRTIGWGGAGLFGGLCLLMLIPGAHLVFGIVAQFILPRTPF